MLQFISFSICIVPLPRQPLNDSIVTVIATWIYSRGLEADDRLASSSRMERIAVLRIAVLLIVL